VLDNSSKILIVPRPRRFGKTLNLSSMRYFLDMDIPEARRRALFEDTEVWRHDGGRLQASCGAHPVIYLSFRQVKERTWDGCLAKVRHILHRMARRRRLGRAAARADLRHVARRRGRLRAHAGAPAEERDVGL
jgi:hypothetical protein